MQFVPFTKEHKTVLSSVIYAMRTRGPNRGYASGGSYSTEDVAMEIAGMLERHSESGEEFNQAEFLRDCGFEQHSPRVPVRIIKGSHERKCSGCLHSLHDGDCRETNDVNFCGCVQ